VTAIISLGSALGVTVVAEGVEVERQATQLRALGCDLAQGFLYAKPLPAAEASELLRAAGDDAVGSLPPLSIDAFDVQAG
jgi:EAL domain-containing protein (putative c-di-GMP-specific phosphodiesterase class I)